MMIDFSEFNHKFFGENAPIVADTSTELIPSITKHTLETVRQEASPSNGNDQDTYLVGIDKKFKFLEFEAKFRMFPSEVRRVLQLCFSSLATVFAEADLTLSKNKKVQKTNGRNKDYAIVYTPLASIPAEAMSMLWEELLNDDEMFDKVVKNPDDDCESNRWDEEDQSTQYWKIFLTEEERLDFFRKVVSSEKDIFEFVRDHLVGLGLLQFTVPGVDKQRSSIGSVCESVNATKVNERRNSLEHSGLRTLLENCHDDMHPQYFCIPRDVQYQYAVFLSGAPFEEGGFSLRSRSKTIKCWSKVMASACIKKIQLAFSSCCHMHVGKDNDGTYRSICIDERSNVLESTEILDLLEQKIKKTESHSVKYALILLPSLLMRAHKTDDAVLLLCSSNFTFIRLVMLGITSGVKCLKKNIGEINLRQKSAEDSSFNPYIITAFEAMRKNLSAEQILEHLPNTQGRSSTQDIGRALHELAWNLEKFGFDDEAIHYYEDALQYKTEYGVKQLSIARTLEHLGRMYLSKRMYNDGIFVLCELLSIQKMQYGYHDLKVAETLKKLATVYGVSEQYDEAISICEEALLIEQTKLGDDSINVLETNNKLGCFYNIVGNYEEALFCYKEALRIGKANSGENRHRLVAKSYFFLGIVYKRNQAYRDALHCFEESLTLIKANVSDQNEDIAKTLHEIGVIHAHLGEWEKAISCCAEEYDCMTKST